jgi:4'-phosphopantetheinyl transferase
VSNSPAVRVSRLTVPLDPDEWLAPHELDRWRRLRKSSDRSRFVASRALLKALVGELAGVAPSAVRLDYRCERCGEQHGRPVVLAPPVAAAWHVSLAHSGDLVVVAAATSPVGVDVECVEDTEFAGFDQVALTPAEQQAVADLPAGRERSQARARHWVRKEAYLKATGEGLRTDPARLTIPARADVTEVEVPIGYVAAVAVLPAVRGTAARAGAAIGSAAR